MKLNGKRAVKVSTGDFIVPAVYYRIWADYGTDFLWRQNDDDIEENDGESYVEAEEVLSSFLTPVLELYRAWVEYYCDYFKTRLEDTQDHYADSFHTAHEQVAWNVAGYLLAWRMAIWYSADNAEYLLERGIDTSVTVKFLENQMELLAAKHMD
ncbi:hypothetical protein N7520_008304 [Penicillium odoratum]|uniref:uncharacterized protein n=1 Tax=Penicillium odoratum TaxID=1167516 RepID=UPI002548AD5D|nr:uncharacterized protein N7520_008304 [Penicillium odoratum]KAJ5761148.1 hypothetical protein N7520_008304 [Penicillium odoratum]